MREYSDIFVWYYNNEESIIIPNISQNAFYLKSGLVNKELMDIFVDQDNLLCFVWHKSPSLRKVYGLYQQYISDKKSSINSENKKKDGAIID